MAEQQELDFHREVQAQARLQNYLRRLRKAHGDWVECFTFPDNWGELSLQEQHDAAMASLNAVLARVNQTPLPADSDLLNSIGPVEIAVGPL